MTQQVIVITGMHRSGTSLVSSVLQEAGVDIGEKLLEPYLGNQRGHFEDVDFVHFHDKVLKRFKQTLLVQSLDDLGSITPAETEAALALIEQRRDRYVWGWKDPRTALFLDFWHSLVPQARYIFVYRHPLEVVLSLLRRGTDLEALANPMAGLRSWQIYNQALLNFYCQHPEICLLANITAITSDIEAFAQCVNQKLVLSLKQGKLQGLYHSTELKQTSFSPLVTAVLEKTAPEIMSLYYRLESRADLPGCSSDQVAPQPDPQLIQLQERMVGESHNQSLGENQRVNFFRHLLSILEPETVNLIWLDHILQLQAQISELQQHIWNIESTRSWRLVLKWYAFKQWLKRLIRLS